MRMVNIAQTEIIAARAWRKRLGLDVPRLAELTGYSPEAIWLLERGKNSQGAPVSAFVWQRFRNCCAGVDAQIRSGVAFDWGR